MNKQPVHITLVKKIKLDGTPCRKCAAVEKKLLEGGYMGQIQTIVTADERNAASEGMLLARKHGVDLAPFFIVDYADGSARVYTIYYQFLKEVLSVTTCAGDEAREIMEQHPDLDYI